MDLGEQRIAHIDERGIDRQILGLTAPGTHVIRNADRATKVAETANDRLAEAIAKYPTRFSGMAACAPQNPKAAAREVEQDFLGACCNAWSRFVAAPGAYPLSYKDNR